MTFGGNSPNEFPKYPPGQNFPRRHDVYVVPDDVPVHQNYVVHKVKYPKVGDDGRKCGTCAGAVTGTLIILIIITGAVVAALYFAGVINFGEKDKLISNDTTTSSSFTSTSALWTTTERPTQDHTTGHTTSHTTGGVTDQTSSHLSTLELKTRLPDTSSVPDRQTTSQGQSSTVHPSSSPVSTEAPLSTQPPHSTVETTPGWVWPHDPFQNRTAAPPSPVRCQLMTEGYVCDQLWSYKSVGFPSLSGVRDQSTAFFTVGQSTFINDTGCYPYVIHWTCAASFTECRQDLLIHPCRSFCLEYEKSCDVAVSCAVYPDDDSDDVCRSSPTGPPKPETRPPFTNPCSVGEFLCGNDNCVAPSVVCDGTDDCGDYRDETDASCSQANALDCDFEGGDLCGWRQGTVGEDGFDWTVTSGQSLSANTGPAFDHTRRGQSSQGHYLLADASGIIPLSTARLVSPPLVVNTTSCFRFYYHMFGEDVDQIRVYIQTGSTSEMAWQRRRNQGDAWYPASVTVPAGEAVVQIEATRGESFRADVAVDDLTLRPGACPTVTCLPGQFRCGNDHCLSREFVCDRNNDCGDFTDEMNCECSADEFRCDMGLCVTSYFRCDRSYDCPDMSDEMNCPCEYGRWACDDGRCIMSEWICDGEPDCTTGEDEASCGECGDNEFQCRDYACVPEAVVCDGNFDCSDKSDELACYRQATGSTVEVRHDDRWLPLCYSGITSDDGDVICRHLGQGPALIMDNITLASELYAVADGSRSPEDQILSNINVTSTCGSVVRLDCVPMECGMRSTSLAAPRVINGQTASLGRWPWQATLYHYQSAKCGGSLLTENHVITAAHCFMEGGNRISISQFRVTVGNIHANYFLDSDTVQERKILRVILHPDYDSLTYFRGYDVAIIVLDQPVTFTDYVRPICLPESPPPLTSLCYSAGLGYTSYVYDYNGRPTGTLPDKLQEIKLQMWSTEKCMNSYSYATSRVVCAGYRSGYASTCIGDSGGPLMCKSPHGRWELAGVFSFVRTGCAVPEFPPVFTNVSGVLPWIKDDGLECVFRCTDGQCLYLKDLVCNGKDDCADGSDEITQCDRSVTCTFDEDFACGYRAEGNKWERKSGIISNNIGPTTDRDSGTYLGSYMFAGRDATLVSPTFSSDLPHCLTFWYHMRGPDPGTLSVSIRGDNPDTLPDISGNQGDLWFFKSREIPSGSGSIAFTATGSSGGAPTIAVDDVELIDGPCSSRRCGEEEQFCGNNLECFPRSELCNFHIRCLTLTDEDSCQSKNRYSCTFDDWYSCGMEQTSYTKQDVHDWRVSQGDDFDLPLLDHNNQPGQYAYLKTAYLGAGDDAVLSLPVKTLDRVACISLYYQLYRGGRLQISLVKLSVGKMLVWEGTKDTSWWKHIQVTLETGIDFIEIRAIAGVTDTEGKPGYVVIDDVTIEDKVCPSPACSPGEMTCEDGSCIERHLVCDGRLDCPGGEDEDASVCQCEPDLFRCDNGRCLRAHVRCDGKVDCQDGSDEVNCFGECRENEFPACAATDGTCKLYYSWCDGYRDCPDGADEKPGCQCADDQFRCGDGSCLPRFRYCDGTVDCKDGRDEPPACTCDPTWHFQCSDGTCLPFEFNCDGKSQCADKSDELNCTCSEEEFKCNNGYCIGDNLYCDGKPDCTEGEDETGCVCRDDQFRCDGGGCITDIFVCDLYIDCKDGTDEMQDCACNATLGEWRCKNGICITEGQMCDKVNDCLDNSDETNCTCNPGDFRCNNGLCLAADFRCDGSDDCGDESDETGCGCKVEEWACKDGNQCIPTELVCDGTPDCTDMSDEASCGSCKSGEFSCHDYTCVPEVARCDGIANCPDKSDEDGCILLEESSEGSLLTGYTAGGWLPVCAEGWKEGWSAQICQDLSLGSPAMVNNVTYQGEKQILQTLSNSGDKFNYANLVSSATTCPSKEVVNMSCQIPKCGTRHLGGVAPFIVGGDLAGEGSWPWSVALLYLGQYQCGAVLVSPGYALTAAHCLVWENGNPLSKVPQYLSVRAGSTRVQGPAPGLQTRGVQAALTHPNYTVDGANYRWNDIAVLKLSSPLEPSDTVGPACLHGNPVSGSAVCYITGWGWTNRDRGEGAEDLREARYLPWGEKECATTAAWGEKYKPDSQICGGYRSGVISSCFGDSGGALVCKDAGGRWRAEGITSLGSRSCGQGAAPQKPTVFSRVSHYTAWINSIIG